MTMATTCPAAIAVTEAAKTLSTKLCYYIEYSLALGVASAHILQIFFKHVLQRPAENPTRRIDTQISSENLDIAVDSES